WELQGTPFAGSRPWVLTLEQKYQKAGGALKSGAEQWPLKEGQVKGETVTFTVEMNAGGRPQTYRFTGTAKSHFLEGDVERVNFNGSSKTQWRAKRDPSTFIPIE
ncbi:MAG TPA: hypothetical protein VLS90_14480, partial [Thermodesulfobacteriota bacterium]|nr:hypothetical protein [Thermodesulfobacteriota bacterium]